MGLPLQAWLLTLGFTANPFEIWQADEEALLERYFVKPGVFDAVRGQSSAQQSVVLFAPRGHGKSALRRLVAYECANDLHHPALVVELTNYDWAADGDTPDRARYRAVLARLATAQLWARLDAEPARLDALRARPLSLLHLHALTAWSARRSSERPPPLALPDEETCRLAEALRLPASAGAEALVAHLAGEYRAAELGETMGELVAVCRAAGYASLLYLVDRVDEDERTEGDWGAALKLIQPLFNLHLLETEGLAFKFFLPDALAATMRTSGVATRLGNRPRRYELTWSAEELVAILRLRLETFSRDARGYARIRSFAELCERVPRADQRLAGAAAGSPRRMIRLARMVVDEHCARVTDDEELIPADRFVAALEAGVAALAAETAEFAPAAAVALAPAHRPAPTALQGHLGAPEGAPGPPPLRLDADGTIWLGGQRYDGELSRQTRQILELLWRHRSRYLSREELCEAIEAEPEALYKAVVRLRGQLEPHRKNSKHYIKDVVGIGYRLSNFVGETSS